MLKATIRCAHCSWTKEMEGDEPLKMGEWLKVLLKIHIKEHHPGEEGPSVSSH